ncbi:4'-phosphopantetheinyl transferase superfamily protein [Streptomyces sp. NPDC052013]|uniref:4'-phosphopantetheinyl transferase superfamily protein n=1 Tax=Streptomyces sp. NPDC052013 TaxID=3365679 RepID=UPI0037D97699
MTEPGLGPVGPVEERLCAALPSARGLEFLAGRLALRRALGRAGRPVAAEIPYQADGVRPELPPGSVGSLSHSGGVAVALAAPAARCAALGVDLERHPLPPSAARVVLGGDEQLYLDGEFEGRERRLRELFSAKESAFKALYGLLPPPRRPTTLRGIAVRPVPGGWAAWARGCPERVLHVNARWAAGAVLTWTVTDRPPEGTG